MCDNEKELNEIMERARKIRERRTRIKTAVIGAAAAVACLVLIITGVNGNMESGVWTKENYGAFILEPQAGDYVLTAAVAFLLGASVITALVLYRRKKLNGEALKETEEEGTRKDMARKEENNKAGTHGEKGNDV